MQKLVLVLFLLFFNFNIQAEEGRYMKLDNFLDYVAQKNKAKGEVSIIQKGQSVYSKKYGSEEQPKDSIFRIGSISKVFTSTLLADAAAKTEVALDEPIHMPLKDDLKITYKQLSNHTSGMPRLPKNLFYLSSFRSDNPYKEYDEKLLEDYLANELVLDQAPGELSSYSNLGAGLLGHLLSIKTGSSYEELLQNRIFSKYEMTLSSSEKDNIEGNLVLGLDKQGEVTSNWDLASLKGAGGIFSTVGDLAKFANAHLYDDDEVLALSRKRTFTLNENMDIALGWHIINTQSGEKWHWHNGGTGGYSSSMAMDIENKKAVILLSNVSAFSKLQKNIDPLCFELMNDLKKQ
jgi:CubicO group peptidase (beta-lactamase class C family)